MTVTELDRDWARATIGEVTDEEILRFKIEYEDWLQAQEDY